MKTAALAALACAAVFGLTFALYGLPMEAVAYPAFLCGMILTAAFFLEWTRRRRKARQIQSGELPQDTTPDGRAYQAMIDGLQRESRQLQAAHAARERERLEDFTVWAHQVKTPIASMRLRLGQEDSPLSRNLESELTRVEQYAEMALAYLRLDSESTDYVFRSLSVDEVVRQALRRFKGDFIAKRLSVNFEPTGATVVSDEKWLLFVLEQILSNAVKYTFQGGVTITVQDDVLEIRDTGIGIAPEDLPRIFEKGYTGLNGRSHQRATGIGLYLCRCVCGKLGHPISAVSTMGEGTTVRIDLRQHRIE